MNELDRLYDLLPWLFIVWTCGGLVAGFVLGRLTKRSKP